MIRVSAPDAVKLPAALACAVATTIAAGATRPLPALVTHGPRSRPAVALTFDADMTPRMLAELRNGRVASSYDSRIVDLLRASRTTATIFLTRLWIERYARVVAALARNPLFELENHSVDHAAWQPGCYGLATVTRSSTKRWEIRAAARAIAAVTGRPPRYFRFPGGCHSGADLAIVAAAGDRAIGWDVVSGDAFEPDPTVVERDVLERTRPGSIVVMHLIGAPNAPATYAALRVILPALRARGYRFVKLTTLVG